MPGTLLNSLYVLTNIMLKTTPNVPVSLVTSFQQMKETESQIKYLAQGHAIRKQQTFHGSLT